MKSILQSEKKCYITGSTLNLHRHHIMFGPYRKKAEHYGLWVWLRSDWHIQTPYAVHNDRALDLSLKKAAQKAFEKKYSHEKWMAEFKRNYLEEENGYNERNCDNIAGKV